MISTATATNASVGAGDENDHAYRRIILAAIEVFGRLGYQKTTIQDIVAVAGVSRPLFYRRFRDKQQVFAAVADALISDWNSTLVTAVHKVAGDTAAALRALHFVSLDYACSQPLLHRLLTRDTQYMLATETDVSEHGAQALRSLIEGILQRGVEIGDVRTDVDVAHMADLLVEIHQVYTRRVVVIGAPLDAALAEGVLKCMLKGVLSSSTNNDRSTK